MFLEAQTILGGYLNRMAEWQRVACVNMRAKASVRSLRAVCGCRSIPPLA
jgi:hypothetical protein